MPHQSTNPITLFLLLPAFASGCTALTGVEAISNGVPAFQPPEARNARITLVWMGMILGTMFAGITWFADQLAIVPNDDETVLSQIARQVFGGGFLDYATQAFTALILILAANTSFAGSGASGSHYDQVTRHLSVAVWTRPAPRAHRVVVPISGVHWATLRALDYARQLGSDITAVHVDYEGDHERILEGWATWGDAVPLVVLTSPYRSLIGPLLEYLAGLGTQRGPDGFVTVVLPEFVPRRWWHHFLHNQSALLLKGALFFRSNVIVVDVPYHLPE